MNNTVVAKIFEEIAAHEFHPLDETRFTIDRELMALRDEFKEANVRIATLEAHDMYRCRIMVGKEVDPKYWFARESFQETYTDNIWWPHLADRAGAVGAAYGVDPMAFSVHAEYINRPTTIIVDPKSIVRFAY